MTRWKKIKSVISASFTIICSLILMANPKSGAIIIIGVLSLALLIYGFRTIIYYFTMARLMVDGKIILYKGLIIFEFGMLVNTLAIIPKVYVMIYLMIGFIFAGVVDIMRALESKSYNVGAWKLQISRGIINVSIGLACLFNLNSVHTMVYICCAGWIYSAIVKIINSFRQSGMVYIQ